MKPKLIKAYEKVISDYLYIIDEYGNMILTHQDMNEITHFEIFAMFDNKYDLLYLHDDDIEGIEIWENLIKLNRSLEPKE